MNSFLKYIIYTCLVIVPFLAAYISTGTGADIINAVLNPQLGTYFPYITGKNFVFRGVILIAFTAWLLLAFRDKDYRPRKSPLTIAVLTFTGLLLVSALLGVDAYKSIFSNYERMEGWIALAHYAMFYIILTSMVKTWSSWQKLLNVYIVSNVLVVGYSLLQLLGAPNFFVAKVYPRIAEFFASRYPITQSAERLDATIGNSAYFAAYAMFFIFLIAYMFSHVKDNVVRSLYAVVIVMNLIALFYTQTRGTLIGLVAGVGVTLIVLAIKEKGKARNYYIGALVGAFLLVASIFVFKDSAIVQNSATLKRVSSISFTEMTSMSRLTIWKMSWEGWKERPIFGYGQDNFQHVFAKHYDPVKMYNQEPWFDRSHNVFFDWLIAGGILGFLAYFAVFFLMAYLLLRNPNVELYPKAIFLGLLTGYMVHNIFVFDNFTSYMLYFTVLALVATLASKSDYFEHKNLKSYTIYLDPLVIVGAIIVFYTTIYNPYLANITAIRGYQAQALVQYAPAEQVIKFHREQFEKALALNSFGEKEVFSQYVQTTFNLVQGNLANTNPSKANEINTELMTTVTALKGHADRMVVGMMDDPVLLPLIANVYGLSGDNKRMVELLERAKELAPNKQLTLLSVIQGYSYTNETQKAYDLAKYTFLLQPEYEQAKSLYINTALANKSVGDMKTTLESVGKTFEPTVPMIQSALSSVNPVDAEIMLNMYKMSSTSDKAVIKSLELELAKVKRASQAVKK